MKRVAGLLLAGAALVVFALPAAAEDEIPVAEQWGGSNVEAPTPVTTHIQNLRVEGRIQNGAGSPASSTYTRPAVAVTLAADTDDDPDVDDGCDTTAPDGPATDAAMSGATFGGSLTARWKAYSYWADVPFAPDRNGTYDVFVCINGIRELDTDIVVRLPAPQVRNVVATASGHSVSLTWADMRGDAPDLSGYRILRRIGEGSFDEVKTAQASETSYSDTSLPPEGGQASYRVIALRPFVGDAAPADTPATAFAAAPAGTPTGGTGGTGAPGGGGGTGGSGGVSPGRPAGSGGLAIQVPRVGTPSRNFFPALLAPPVDTGFSEDLPYDESEPGNELAGEDLDDAVDGLPGRGLVIPIATGLVLAVWALHFRFLARASRPEYDDGIEILS